jgi:hypothetical protein
MRLYTAERRVQARVIEEVETSFGTVRMKVAANGAFSPEYEDCRRLALEKDVSLRAVIAEANAIFSKEK